MPQKNKKTAGSGVIYVTVHLGDHRADVAGLSAEERGVYESLRMAYYQRGGPLPNGLSELYRLAEAFTAGERKAVKRVLEQKFELDGEAWRNGQCDAELERVAKLRTKRQQAAQARWGDANAYPSALQMDMQTACYPVNHNPETSKEDKTTNKAIYPPSPSKDGMGERLEAAVVTGPNGPATTTTSSIAAQLPPSQPIGSVAEFATFEQVRDVEARVRRARQEHQSSLG